MPDSWKAFHFPVPQYNLWTGQMAFLITPGNRWETKCFGFYLGDGKRWVFNYRWESYHTHRRPFADIFPAVVPVNYFIEGTDRSKLREPYLYRRIDGGMLFLAAIVTEKGFALVTVPAPPFVQQRGKSRSPLLFETPQAVQWLQGECIAFPSFSVPMTSYPVSSKITSKQNDPSLVQPYLTLF